MSDTEHVSYHYLASPLGDLLVTDHGRGLSGVYFPEHRHGPLVASEWEAASQPFVAVATALEGYFSEGTRGFDDLALDPRGTAMQLQVWEALRACAYGETTTYGKIAADVGRPTAVRAVASAIGRNPLSIIVPCHRVVGASGSLTGYAGGIDRKRRLLELERAFALG